MKPEPLHCESNEHISSAITPRATYIGIKKETAENRHWFAASNTVAERTMRKEPGKMRISHAAVGSFSSWALARKRAAFQETHCGISTLNDPGKENLKEPCPPTTQAMPSSEPL